MRPAIFFQRRWAGVWLLLALLTACAEERQPGRAPGFAFPLPAGVEVIATAGRMGGDLDYTLHGEPSSFNFAMAENTRTKLVTGLITGTLLEFDPQQLRVGPGVAREWSVSPDSRSIRVRLREGLRFSDGHPVTSDDLIFTLDRLFEEDSRTALGDLLRLDGEPLQARRIDESTVLITFPREFAAAEYVLSYIPVFPAHLMSDADRKLEDYWKLSADPAAMAGLGPFMLAEHVPTRRTILQRNPHYWRADREGRRLPYLDRIVIHYVARRDTQVLRLEAGEIDLLDSHVRPADLTRLEGRGYQLMDAGPSLQLNFLWFNLSPSAPTLPGYKKDWFSNIAFRRAVSLGVDRRAIVETVFRGRAEEAWGLIPASVRTWYAPSVRKYPHDPARAQSLLTRAGFSRIGQGERTRLVGPAGHPVQFEIFCRSDQEWGRIGALVQQDLEGLGMEVSLRQEEFRALISRVGRSRDYEAAILGIDFPYEPVEHQNVLLSSAPMHFWNPSQEQPATAWEAEIDGLVLQQITTLDLAGRQRIFRRIQEILSEEVPFVPLVNQHVLAVAGPHLRNLKPVPLFPHTLWNSWELSF